MANSAFGSVDEYLGWQTQDVALALSEVRDAIRSALPNAEECIAYNMPCYKVDGKAVIFLAGWKSHYSVYPASEALVSAFSEELAEHKVVKDTIRFSYKKPVPSGLLKRIAEFRALEMQFKSKGR